MIQVDIKMTGWERLKIDDEKAKEVLKGLKNKTIKNIDDLYEIAGDYIISEGIDIESVEQMTVEENKGNTTVIVFDEKGNDLFDNGTKSP